MSDQFQLGLRRAFLAQHALIGGDWGAENQPHSHEYLWEVRLSAFELDRHGYLVDLLELEQAVSSVVASYADSYLNENPAFVGINPSLERFAKVLGQHLLRILPQGSRGRLESVLWENETAWASWRET